MKYKQQSEEQQREEQQRKNYEFIRRVDWDLGAHAARSGSGPLMLCYASRLDNDTEPRRERKYRVRE